MGGGGQGGRAEKGKREISIITNIKQRHSLKKNFYNFNIGTRERVKNIPFCDDHFILAN